MTFRSKIATTTAKSSHWLLRKLGRGGTSFPGKVSLKLDPNILATFKDDYDSIIVTGTNGKTLTTALIAKVLAQGEQPIVTNTSGSNMVQGIAGTFVTAKRPKGQKPLAVLEVDEANVERVAKAIQPKAFVLTNIFRDQLDRYGEIYTTYDLIVKGIKAAPDAKVIANGDSPIFARGDFKNERVYFGFNHRPMRGDHLAPHNTDGILSPTDDSVLHYHYLTYANQGAYFSVTDDFKRPELTYSVNKLHTLTSQTSSFEIDKQFFNISIGGLYNIYNALAAYAVGREFGMSVEKIKTAFESDTRVFGRQETFKANYKQVTIVLIKNPVGTNSVIDMMLTDKHPFSLITLLNANYADGIDTSWIWDAEFEKLQNQKLKAMAVGGERYRDIDVRLKMAGFKDYEVIQEMPAIIKTISKMPTEHVYIAATYTAMLQLREQLVAAGYIKESF